MSFAVPRVWEKVFSTVAIASREAGRVQQLAYGWALGEGMKLVKLAEAGITPGALQRLNYWLARTLVHNNVRRMIGLNRVQLALTGAAPISPELIRWYLALGTPLREG